MKYLNDRCIVSDDNVFYYDSEQEITQADVMRFILENEQLAREYAKMRRYYKADHDAIVKAKQKPNNKPDNRLVLNYPKKLVDTFTGFSVGKPVQITLPEDLGNKSLSQFNVSRKMDSVIARVWKESCIFGRAYFYVYSHDSEIYVTDALPLDTFVIYDNTVAHKPLYAVRYGHVGASASYKLTVFSERYQWESNTSQNTSNLGTRVANPFGMIPIIEAVENDERLSVIKNVLPLIDEINKAMSEKANDVDYFADAYMKVLGAILSEDDLENLRNYRIINLKSRESDDPNETPESLDVDFLSKPNADTTQENLINRVIDNLYQVSMITNLNDKDFGNSTGVALEMKYKPMLNLATLKSRGFIESLKDMYQVVFASDLIENISREAWKDLDINFQYDLPHDTLSEAQTAQILSNLVSSETWLKTLSIVNDPRQEQERMDREKNEQMKANMQVLKQTNALTDGDANANSRTSQKRIDYLLERDQATEAEIEKVYNEAVDTLRAIVSDVHNRYAVDGVVVPANLYGKVTVKDMLLLKQQYDKLPDDLSAQEQDRVDYYTAMSQTSPRGLITALVGMALIGVTHKVGKIIAKNNRTAVKEEIAYQAEHEKAPKMTIKKYADPDFEVETGKDFVPWTERVLSNHDQAVNRINNVINSMISQGMRAEDIANHFYPGNAQSMRDDNIPKILRDATVKAKRTARTEAAAREDAITEQNFKANDVKYYGWITEPGACKVCTSWAISGPYKVGDESSPRIPGDSHPNCRCRRIGVYKSGPYDFIDLSDIDESKFKELERRLNNVIKVYKAETGIDIRQAIKDGTFSNKTLDRKDVKTGFIDWLFHEVGYDAKPRVVKTFSAHEWFNKIAENPKDPNYLEKPTVFYRGIRANGDIGMDKIKFDLFKGDYIPSGTFTSDWGRGIYMTKHKQTTDRYTRGVGEVLELGLASDIKILVADQEVRALTKALGLEKKYITDTHYDIVAVLSGYDIVRENKYAVELNVMNRGKIEWKDTNT